MPWVTFLGFVKRVDTLDSDRHHLLLGHGRCSAGLMKTFVVCDLRLLAYAPKGLWYKVCSEQERKALTSAIHFI